MKPTTKLLLDNDDEDELNVGLIKLRKDVPFYELFYHINRSNPNNVFERINDIKKIGKYYEYRHLRFQTFHQAGKTCIQIIANKSVEYKKISENIELFSDEEEVNFLLPNCKDIDYLIKTSDNFDDFSLILFPENFVFPIQNFSISSSDELYELLMYYE